jgi:hypothetical protein
MGLFLFVQVSGALKKERGHAPFPTCKLSCADVFFPTCKLLTSDMPFA